MSQIETCRQRLAQLAQAQATGRDQILALERAGPKIAQLRVEFGRFCDVGTSRELRMVTPS